jgi:hypothetical protein
VKEIENSINKIKIRTLEFEITKAKVDYRLDKSNNLIICPDITTDFVKFVGVSTIIRLFNEDGFNTGVKSIRELKGKSYTWNETSNVKGSYPGFLYVFDHEEIPECTLEILEADDTKLVIHWFGKADIFLNNRYGTNVPFETTFEVYNNDIKEVTL